MISCLEHFERVTYSKAFKKAHCYSHQHTSMMLEQTTMIPALRYVSHPLEIPKQTSLRVNIVGVLKFSEVHRWRWPCVPGSWTRYPSCRREYHLGQTESSTRWRPSRLSCRVTMLSALWRLLTIGLSKHILLSKTFSAWLLEAHCSFIAPEKSLTASGPGIYIYMRATRPLY